MLLGTLTIHPAIHSEGTHPTLHSAINSKATEHSEETTTPVLEIMPTNSNNRMLSVEELGLHPLATPALIPSVKTIKHLSETIRVREFLGTQLRTKTKQPVTPVLLADPILLHSAIHQASQVLETAMPAKTPTHLEEEVRVTTASEGHHGEFQQVEGRAIKQVKSSHL